MAQTLRQSSLTGRPTEPMTVAAVFLRLARHPSAFLLRRWNWKSATLSCLIRGSIFFAVNLVSDFAGASRALLLEISIVSVTAGFYGSFIQAFRTAKPEWAATLTVMMMPLLHHTLEFLIHSFGGTRRLAPSILISIVFSALSACFNLYAMRRGVLIVGKQRQSFVSDLKQLPGVVLGFLLIIPKAVLRLINDPGN